MTPEISIITVNYNGWLETGELVESLHRHVTSNYELIVVDNGSRHDEARLLQEHYPDIKCIRSEKNLGFAGGNNLGIGAAVGKYILLLNNDVYVTDDTLDFLCEAFKRRPEIGAVGPKIRFTTGRQHIQFAGYTPLSAVTLRNRTIGYGEDEHGQYNVASPTPYLHGAAMMVKREVIERVGLMPTIYFLYYEELDWCTEMTEAGYELWYEPSCTVYHKESSTTGKSSPLKSYYLTRNRLLYAWRHRRGWQLWAGMFYQWGVVIPKNAGALLLKCRFGQAMAILKGGIAFLVLKNKRMK